MGALLEDLSDPGNHPEPRPTQVDLVTTHISWVLLTDDRVYKIKRPVDLGFLDFSTLERRRHYCAEELRLNRRLASEVYLDVVPIRHDGERHHFGDDGEVVDYAVLMRRMPAADSAEELVQGESLHAEHIDSLVRLLRSFYAAAPATPDHGRPEHVADNARGNFTAIADLEETGVEKGVIDRIRDWQESWLARSRDLLQRRREDGHVRDCHGDLRLEHIYFRDGRADATPVVLDTIEFSSAFRCIDVAADVAFLAMDLDRQDRQDLASWFLARFATLTGDYELYTVIDFYLAYRACVRGKVACLLAADTKLPQDQRRRQLERSGRYFHQAASYCRPRRARRVIAVGGPIASGKSTLAAELSRRLGLPVIRADATRKRLAGLEPEQRGGEELYSAAMTRRTYATMRAQAETVLSAGRDVILDATFRRAEQRAAARALAEEHGCAFRFVECRCDKAVRRQRLRRREGDSRAISDAREALLDRIDDELEPLALATDEHLAVDSGGEVRAAVTAVLDSLAAERPRGKTPR